MKGGKHRVFWLAAFVVLPLLLRGQCDPLPLPYTTDLITGFHVSFTYEQFSWGEMYDLSQWEPGANQDNCWMGYLWRDEREGIYNNMNASGHWGFGQYNSYAGAEYYCNIGVLCPAHPGVAMLIAPEFEEGLASISISMQLMPSQPMYQQYHEYDAYIDYGWVRDIAHPMESFEMEGSLRLFTHRPVDNNWDHHFNSEWPLYAFPVREAPPQGSHFALRLRSEVQVNPYPHSVVDDYFQFDVGIKEFTASTTIVPVVTTDTVYLSDTVCQHTSYSGHGFTVGSAQTADTGLQTFVMRNYEHSEDGPCEEHMTVLTLRVLPSELTFVRDSIFPGEAYTFFGRELTLAGGYVEDWGVNAYGCPIKDSLQLSIRPLPPMPCGAEIEVERTDYYLSQPTEVHLWTESEGTRYLWRAIGLTGDSTQRDAYVMLQPESAQQVRLEVERVDTVNHIYRGSAMDTTILGTYELSVPVEPQTRYLLEADASADVGLQVQGRAPESIAWSNGRLRATFVTSRSAEVTLTFSSSVAANLSRMTLRRYCLEEDLVRLVAHILQPRIVADRERICLGDSVVLHAEQTDYYRWAMRPEDTTFDGCPGCRLLTVSPQTTTTYYLLTPGGTVADSVVIVVQPYPELRVVADVEAVDFDNPVLTLEELSEAVKRVRWSFSDGGEATGRKVRWHFGNVTGDSLWVNVEGCTEIGCCSDTLLVFPISIVSVWFPNVFTPDGEMNNRFAMVTNQAVVEYEMTIYNRQGLLVARCTDAVAGWDGRDIRGAACQQGAYAYICEYRLAGNVAKRYLGTVLLLR